MLDRRIDALLADMGYEAGPNHVGLAAAGIEAVIPTESSHRFPIPHYCEKYRWRNLVERLFSKLKNWRQVAARYDKAEGSYLGFVALASFKMSIPFVHDAYRAVGTRLFWTKLLGVMFEPFSTNTIL
jgi:transposase